MKFYLFRSTSGGLAKALCTNPEGSRLPSVLAPWTRHAEDDALMEHVEAVSDRIQAGLDARGYHLLSRQAPVPSPAPTELQLEDPLDKSRMSIVATGPGHDGRT
jgi:hypothetical protein